VTTPLQAVTTLPEITHHKTQDEITWTEAETVAMTADLLVIMIRPPCLAAMTLDEHLPMTATARADPLHAATMKVQDDHHPCHHLGVLRPAWRVAPAAQ